MNGLLMRIEETLRVTSERAMSQLTAIVNELKRIADLAVRIAHALEAIATRAANDNPEGGNDG